MTFIPQFWTGMFFILWVSLWSAMLLEHSTYLSFKENSIQGRYLINAQITSFLETLNTDFKIEEIGSSVEGRRINSVTVGWGSKKVLMWSQMHGNESTTTKAVLDLLRFLESDNQLANAILTHCTLKIIPILNPDGAEAYTRANANRIDLNRDAQNLSQPESRVLRKVYNDFQPNFCFNLHDQRTIYNVGITDKPATVSFLAPSHDKERSISDSRVASMRLIAAINNELQELIPGQIGRYDDVFNSNCVGDSFQILETPTVLFEAGHFHEDYEREKTRWFIFQALCTALYCVGHNKIQSYVQDDYFKIPENNKHFFDILVKNAHFVDVSNEKDIGILFTEVLKEGEIRYEPRIEKQGDLSDYFGHQTYDCAEKADLNFLKKAGFWNLLKS